MILVLLNGAAITAKKQPIYLDLFLGRLEINLVASRFWKLFYGYQVMGIFLFAEPDDGTASLAEDIDL